MDERDRVQCKIRSGKNWKKERKEREIQWNENKTARENPADKKRKNDDNNDDTHHEKLLQKSFYMTLNE